jgi:DNA-binding protein H-NS
MKNIAITILSLALIMVATGLNGQDKKEKVKVVVIEKTTDENGNAQEVKVIKEGDEAKKYINEMKKSEDKHIWISKDGEEIDLSDKEYKVIKKKKVKMIQKDDDGNEEIIEWSGEGEMPEEIKSKLQEHDIDILVDDIIDNDLNNEDNPQNKKIVKMIQKDDNGEQKVIEWEGEGEMPDDIKKVLEEHDIDIDVVMQNNEEKEMTVTMDRSSDTNTKIKIMKSYDGNEKEIDIDMEGDILSDDMKKFLEENGIQLKNIRSTTAQLGVFIESEVEGVRILDIVEGSSAEEAGLQVDDIIVSINDTKMNSIEELMSKIREFNPGDIVKVTYLRDSKIENIEVALKAFKMSNRKVMKKTEEYIFKEK